MIYIVGEDLSGSQLELDCSLTVIGTHPCICVLFETISSRSRWMDISFEGPLAFVVSGNIKKNN